MRIGFLPMLTLIFVTLKLTEVIAWSWWFVLMPLYVAPIIIGLMALAVYLTAMNNLKDGD